MKNLETTGKIGIVGRYACSSECCRTIETTGQDWWGKCHFNFAKGDRFEQISQPQWVDISKKTNQTVRSADQ